MSGVLEEIRREGERKGKLEGIEEGIEVGKREGIEVGKREGIEVGKLEMAQEMARRLLVMKTMSYEEIAAVVGLFSVEEIKAMDTSKSA